MLEKIRDDQQFPNLDAMIEQLAVDEARSRAILADVGNVAGNLHAKAL
jgi:FAD synthase